MSRKDSGAEEGLEETFLTTSKRLARQGSGNVPLVQAYPLDTLVHGTDLPDVQTHAEIRVKPNGGVELTTRDETPVQAVGRLPARVREEGNPLLSDLGMIKIPHLEARRQYAPWRQRNQNGQKHNRDWKMGALNSKPLNQSFRLRFCTISGKDSQSRASSRPADQSADQEPRAAWEREKFPPADEVILEA